MPRGHLEFPTELFRPSTNARLSAAPGAPRSHLLRSSRCPTPPWTTDCVGVDAGNPAEGWHIHRGDRPARGPPETVGTEAVYRKQLRPVIIEGAEAMDRIVGPDG